MQPIEFRETPDADPTLGYHRILSQVLYGWENYPRLSFTETVQYGESIFHLRKELGKVGDVNRMDAHPNTVPSRVKSLFEQYQRATNELVEGHLRLMWPAFRGSPSLWDLPDCNLKDLAGVAQEELLRSAKHYNPWYYLHSPEVPYETRSPLSFSTYAVKNMHLKMLTAAKYLPDMHIPSWRIKQYEIYLGVREFYVNQQINAGFDTSVIASEFMRAYKRLPTPEELEAYYDRMEHDFDARRNHRKMIGSYAKLLIMMQPVSYEAVLTGKKQFRNERTGEVAAVQYSMEGVVASLDDVPRAVIAEELKEILQNTLQYLSERERGVLELRYGLEDGDQHTLKDIAQYYNVTEERIRQIEEKALRKLRHPLRLRDLRDFR